jgi:hypothetical protein
MDIYIAASIGEELTSNIDASLYRLCASIERTIYLAGRFRPSEIEWLVNIEQRAVVDSNIDNNSTNDQPSTADAVDQTKLNDDSSKVSQSLRFRAMASAARSMRGNLAWLIRLHESCATAMAERARCGIDTALAAVAMTTTPTDNNNNNNGDGEDDVDDVDGAAAAVSSSRGAELRWLSREPFTMRSASTLQYRFAASYHRVVRVDLFFCHRIYSLLYIVIVGECYSW